MLLSCVVSQGSVRRRPPTERIAEYAAVQRKDPGAAAAVEAVQKESVLLKSRCEELHTKNQEMLLDCRPA